jgi:glycosyltransferase involved in cell wall biosynthesis
MKKKVLLVFPGLRIKNDEGAKHRLNSFINAYYDSGCEVVTLAFVKGSIAHSQQYLNNKCTWLLFPYIFPLSMNRFLSNALLIYLKVIVAIVSYIKRVDIVQMEGFSLKSCLCYPKSKYYVDFHGDVVYEYVETDRGDLSDWFSKLMLKVQKDSVSNTQKVICVTTKLKEQLEINTHTTIKDYSIISCGVDLNRFNVEPAKPEVDINNRIIVGYCGGLQKWQNIDKILDIVLALRKIDTRIFFFLFTNSDISSIMDKLQEVGEGNYCVRALKSAEVPAYLKLLDAGFLIRDNYILNKVSSPTKISEYLAAGAGLICTSYSGDYEIYTSIRKESVFVLDSFSDEEFVCLFDWLKERKAHRLSNEFLKEFTFENQFKKAQLL